MACTRQGDRSPSGPPRSHSTPLNSCGRFVGDAVHYRTDFAYLVGDAAGNLVEKVIRELGEARGEAVDAPHCPKREYMAQTRAVALALGVHRMGERRSGLPYGLVQIRLAKLLDINTIAGARDAERFRVDLALDAHHQARAGGGVSYK